MSSVSAVPCYDSVFAFASYPIKLNAFSSVYCALNGNLPAPPVLEATLVRLCHYMPFNTVFPRYFIVSLGGKAIRGYLKIRGYSRAHLQCPLVINWSCFDWSTLNLN